MKQIEGQLVMDECKNLKPLIYSLSSNWFRTICPYCKLDNPDSTDVYDCTKRDRHFVDNRKLYPFVDLPFNFCPQCGKEFDTNCEIKMTKGFLELNPDYIERHKLVKDDKGRWRQIATKGE